MRVPLKFEDVMVGDISKYCRKELVKANIAPFLFKTVLYFKGWDVKGQGRIGLSKALQLKFLVRPSIPPPPPTPPASVNTETNLCLTDVLV